jgi:hypothetical protein
MPATPERINAVHAAIRLSGWAALKKQGSLAVAPLAFGGRVAASAAAIEVATNIDAAMYPQPKRMTTFGNSGVGELFGRRRTDVVTVADRVTAKWFMVPLRRLL